MSAFITKTNKATVTIRFTTITNLCYNLDLLKCLNPLQMIIKTKKRMITLRILALVLNCSSRNLITISIIDFKVYYILMSLENELYHTEL